MMHNNHYWLALLSIPTLGPATIQRCLTHFENIKSLFTANHTELHQSGLTPSQIHAIQTINWKSIHNDLTWLTQNNCHIIHTTDNAYPKLLRETINPPPILFAQGNTALLNHPQLAIVGSRNPTVTGAQLAEQFAKQLTSSGLTITSGLALGIDAASHRGALASQGQTIAVIGTGLKKIYPASHSKLAEQIIHQGVIVTEFLPNTPPKATNFPRRNRIISGMSLGVLVIEAALKSGSLITARFAVEQNREVFAMPGSIHNPLARGCHQLIRQGAKLVETAQDIIEELGALNSVLNPPIPLLNKETLDLPPSLELLFAQIGYEVTPLDVIILRSGLTAGEVSSMLLALELAGYVQAVSGGYTRTL